MVWCIRIGLLIVFISTQLLAQDTKGPDAVKQAPPVEQVPAAQSTKSDYPLDAFRDFSAIMIGSRMGVGAGSDTSEGSHIYRSGDLMRVEGAEKHGYFVTNLKT